MTTTRSPSLLELVLRVHRARWRAANAKRALKEKEDAFRQGAAPYYEEVAATSADVQDAETALRSAALATYAVTNDRNVVPGFVTVRNEQQVDLVNAPEALRWCRTTELGLKIDWPVLTQIAKAQPYAIPGVVVRVEPRVTLSTKLGATADLDITTTLPVVESQEADHVENTH